MPPDTEFGMHTHSDGSGIFSYAIKNAVVIKLYDCVRIDLNGEVDLPSGDDDVNARYCVVGLDSAEAGETSLTGSTTSPKRVSVATGQPSVPFRSQAAIEAGKRIASKGTDGRVYQTASAGFATANNSVSAADKTVYAKQD